jgi:[ribosomal protein S18]-alanine N-acetyltransferase
VRFTVRDYRPADFDAIWAIDQSCFAPGIAYTPYELRTYIQRTGAFTLVAEAQAEVGAPGSQVLGFVVAEANRRGIGHVITIDVRAQARRYRVGSTLLDDAEQRLRVQKCQVVRLETAVDNLSALHFYKRHGYDVIKIIPHYYSDGVDALLLEKDLLSSESCK